MVPLISFSKCLPTALRFAVFRARKADQKIGRLLLEQKFDFSVISCHFLIKRGRKTLFNCVCSYLQIRKAIRLRGSFGRSDSSPGDLNARACDGAIDR